MLNEQQERKLEALESGEEQEEEDDVEEMLLAEFEVFRWLNCYNVNISRQRFANLNLTAYQTYVGDLSIFLSLLTGAAEYVAHCVFQSHRA